MNATIKAATPRSIIRTKTVYTRENGSMAATTRVPTPKRSKTTSPNQKNLYITTVEQAFSAAC
jgi:hypothetical protein